MKFSNPILLLSALVASTGVNASLYKECNNNGQVSLIVDGFTKAEGPTLLKTLQTNGINALVVLPQASLVGKENLELAEEIKKAGHELGYRVLFPQGAGTMATLKEKELNDELEGAKIRFKDLYKSDLRYVFFPYTTEAVLEKRLGEIATKIGLVAVGHNFYLSPKAEQAKSEILSRFYAPQNASYIVLVEGTVNQAETLKYYKEQIIKNKFTVVPMSKCLAGPKNNGEKITRVPIISGGNVPVKGSATQKKTNKISNKSSKKNKNKSSKGKKFFVNPDAVKKSKKISNKKISSKNNKTSGSGSTGPIKREAGAVKMQVKLDEAPKDKDTNNLIKIDQNTVKNSTNPAVKIDGETNKEEDAEKLKAAEGNSAAGLGLSVGTLAVTIVAGLFAIL